MHLISILLIVFILFFIFTRQSIVRIANIDETRIEIHMPIFAIVIGQRRRQKSDKKRKMNRRAIFAAVRRLVKNGKININKVKLPYSEDVSFAKEIGYNILYATTISYIESICGGLNFIDNAIILSPDVKNIQYDISISSYLYEIFYAIIRLGFHKLKEKLNVRT